MPDFVTSNENKRRKDLYSHCVRICLKFGEYSRKQALWPQSLSLPPSPIACIFVHHENAKPQNDPKAVPRPRNGLLICQACKEPMLSIINHHNHLGKLQSLAGTNLIVAFCLLSGNREIGDTTDDNVMIELYCHTRVLYCHTLIVMRLYNSMLT